MKHVPIVLLISIPFTSVLMGAVMLYFALQTPMDTSQVNGTPLTKTSWQATEDQP
jgi:hypothetical protein